jgi:hypothetical protein
MNLVGKIFIVLIMLMSFVFMGFALAVYATHQNWEEAAKKLKSERDAAATARTSLETEKAHLEETTKTELAARQARLGQLETEAKELRTEHDALVNEHAQLVQRERSAVAAMQSTQEEAAKMRKELDVLRTDVRTAQTERDDQFKEYVKLTDDFNQLQGELKRLQAQTTTLADQIAKYRQVANRLNINLDVRPESVPPKVDGLVLATNKDGLVEISLGSDDGLELGNQLDVYRGSRYLGKIEVSRTSPDKSVAKILPQFRKGPIEKDDHVATRFN